MSLHFEALRSSERKLYEEAVRQTHWRRVELQILTLNGKVHRSLTNKFLGGSIQGDDSRTPVELLDCSLLDDDFVLDWHHGQHRKYLAKVVDARFVPALDDWVEDVIFTGPLWDFDRTGAVVALRAQGAERLAMGSVRRVIDEPRKSKATAVVRKLLKATGVPDAALRIPSLKARLPEAVTVGIRRGKKRPDSKKDKDKKKEPPSKKQIYRAEAEDSYWHEADSIMQATDRDLYADNHARFIAATASGRPVAKVTARQLLSPVKVTRGAEGGEAPNHWIILGAHPKGKKQVRAEVSLPAKHPRSPQALAWHGAPYEITEVVENKHLRRHAQALALGKKKRNAAMSESVSYEAEFIPVVPWFRPGAVISLAIAGGGKASARAHQWTRPLGPDAAAFTIGANRRSGW